MSTPLDAYQLTFQFQLNRAGTTEDLAEFGLWLSAAGGAEYGDAQLLDIAQGAYDAWAHQVNGEHWTTNVTLTDVVATTYLANGHTLAEQVFLPDTPWVGTAPTPAMPWETSLAVSLYTYTRGTFVTNGKRKRGRFFLPPMAANQLDASNSGYFNNSGLAALLLEMTEFLAAAELNTEHVNVGRLSVFSRTDSVLRPVTQVTLDAKFDSQRRRQNREEAGYIQAIFS